MTKRTTTLLVALILLGGCGGSAEPKKSEPVPKAYSVAQLEAAMPVLAELPDAKKIRARCPGDDDCVKSKSGDVITVDWEPEPLPTGADAELAARDGWFNELGYLAVTQFPSAAAAEKGHDAKRKEASSKAGDFDVKVEKLEETGRFSPGAKGTGTIKDMTIDGWSGFVAQRSVEFINPDGVSSGKFEEVRVDLTSGRSTIFATVALEQEGRTFGDALEMTRAIVKDYLARLDAK